MRTINDIQKEILDKKNQTASLSALEVLTNNENTLLSTTSTSKVAIWRLWVYVVAVAIYVHEKIVTVNAENSRPHTIRWYREQCLNFLDGLPLVWKNGQFGYDLSNVTDVAIRKIIARCAILESANGELVVKVAKTIGPGSTILQPLANDELLRFKTYVSQIKDAGNRIRFINNIADNLKINLTVYVDPLIIDLQTGQLLNSQTALYPVKDAINSYLANLQFNGAFVREYFRDSLQTAPGVKLPLINVLQSQAIGFSFINIENWIVPQSGYFAINDLELTINYLPHELDYSQY